MTKGTRIIIWCLFLELFTVAVYFCSPYQFPFTYYGQIGSLVGLFGGLFIILIWHQIFEPTVFFQADQPPQKVELPVIVSVFLLMFALQMIEERYINLFLMFGGALQIIAIIVVAYMLIRVIFYRVRRTTE